jgi:tripartite-type tricarboxylate transporter receptor subunit TctC
MLAKSPPDGYTIGGGNIATHAINMSVYAKMPYDNVRDFVSVAIFTTSPNILVVHPSLPIKSLAEYLAYAKANPGKLTFASPGSGSSVHLAGELLKLRTGAQITHVPYKGSGPAISDLVGGHVLSAFENSTSIVPQIKTGRVRAIAVTTARRAASFPDLPTIAEAGVPGYEVSSWQALFAPAGTPREIALRLNAAVRRVLALPDVREKLLGLDCEPADMTPGQFADFVEVETVKWAAVVKAARITAE